MKKIAIVMGSESDRPVVERAIPYLDYFEIGYELRILSAHRTADAVVEFASSLEEQGYFAVIAAAGMANHLAGTFAARTALPVIGLPLQGGFMDGFDALLSTVQMPGGVPVATMSIGKAGAVNAAVFAARIAALSDEKVKAKLIKFAKAGYKIPG
ncbi:MAG: 5-(carboxyamino)imidazole ribonucleotide mutase [Candidatus Electryonea clarkiae]|nr:5-(carboxyamino)imidazole ribonucleotide mutase [Candidatus Electryonea clarkiae]MDP8286039.1 5-(carboxyamino)imidazole ribonucleotide mutase [Candidatus Electryonea clarkiae]